MTILGVSFVPVHAAAYWGLQYNLTYTAAGPGQSMTTINAFTNSGNVVEQITGLSLSTDMGTFTANSGLPIIIQAGQISKLNMTISIPSSASTGTHAVTAVMTFQYQDPTYGTWVTPSASPFNVSGNMNVSSPPSSVPPILSVAGFGALIGAAVGALVGVRAMRRRKKKGQVPSNIPLPQPIPPPPPQSS